MFLALNNFLKYLTNTLLDYHPIVYLLSVLKNYWVLEIYAERLVPKL